MCMLLRYDCITVQAAMLPPHYCACCYATITPLYMLLHDYDSAGHAAALVQPDT